jgi:hypothetical protein
MRNIIILYLCFSYIKCYCGGTHNRKDLNKKECAKYEIEKEEISGGTPEDYECCFIYSLVWNDVLKDECTVESKDKTSRAFTKAAEASPLNIFNMKIECSFNTLITKLFNIIVLLLILI